MSSKPKADSTSAHPDRKRGRGGSRGGLGKYLRARGRRGAGRPAQFHERLLLEGEKPEDEDEDEEAAAALRAKYGPRQLSSNADRYAESEPELDSDGAFQDIKLTSQRGFILPVYKESLFKNQKSICPSFWSASVYLMNKDTHIYMSVRPRMEMKMILTTRWPI